MMTQFPRRLSGRAFRRWCIVAAVTAFVLPMGARPALAQQCKGVSMPPQIQIQGQELVLNGMGAREATVFNVDVYIAGLYLPERVREGDTVLETMPLMRMNLQIVRDVERGEMNEAIRNGFRRNAGERLSTFQPRIRQFEQLIPDLRDGDRISFTYRPEGQGDLVVHVNGQLRGRIVGKDFAQTFFAIWLGDHPPNAGLKRGLLGGRC